MPSGPRMPNCAAQLVAPLPSNKVRGVLVEAVQSLTEVPGVKYAVWGTLALNLFYFWCDAIDWPAARHRARSCFGCITIAIQYRYWFVRNIEYWILV